MYQIIIYDKAFKQVGKLEKDLQNRIFSILERIRIRPEAYVTKLVGEPGYKLRVGDYRIILDIDKDKLILIILRVGYWKNVHQ